MEAIKSELKQNSPSVAFKSVSSASGGVASARQPGDLPRSLQQLYDIKCKASKTEDEMLQYAVHSDQPCVIEHQDIPEDIWVLGKPHMLHDLSRFCTSETLNHPISVDPTFNFGRYEVTPVTYKHLFLKSKRTGSAPSFLGPTALHYSKKREVYKKITHAICNSTPNLARCGKGFITDGEEALFGALGEELRHATGLRCFRHFRQNCQKKLHSLGVQKATEQQMFIDGVFGTHSKEGLLDAEDKLDLKKRMREAKLIMEKNETEITGKEPNFWGYIEGHERMMRKCMIGSARRKAGMPLDGSDTPLRSYTNQSESINNKLTRMKEAITKNNKVKTNLTKLKFTRDVWEAVDNHQQEEMRSALAGMSEEYELADIVTYLQVPTEEWFEMNEKQRMEYTSRFNKLSVDDVMAKKKIRVADAPATTDQRNEYRDFPDDLQGQLEAMGSWTNDLIGKIIEESRELLNNPNAVQRKPCQIGNEAIFLVFGKNSKRGFYECKVHHDHIQCTCKNYRYNNMCKHSLCVAEIVGLLSEHMSYLRKSRRQKNPTKSTLVDPPKEAQGKKGGCHKNPWRPTNRAGTNQDSMPQRPYTELHHNDEPFGVCFLCDVPNERKNDACKQCHVAFPRRQLISPFDIVISHREKWYYPHPQNPSRRLPSAQLTTRYYCVKRSCILSRFPYFSPSLLEINEPERSRLQKSHFDLLRNELDLDSPQ